MSNYLRIARRRENYDTTVRHIYESLGYVVSDNISDVLADKAKYQYGWIKPDGVFIETGHSGHQDFLDSVGFEEELVEALGWVKITYSEMGTFEDVIFCNREINVNQYSTLLSLGFVVNGEFGLTTSYRRGIILNYTEDL